MILLFLKKFSSFDLLINFRGTLSHLFILQLLQIRKVVLRKLLILTQLHFNKAFLISYRVYCSGGFTWIKNSFVAPFVLLYSKLNDRMLGKKDLKNNLLHVPIYFWQHCTACGHCNSLTRVSTQVLSNGSMEHNTDTTLLSTDNVWASPFVWVPGTLLCDRPGCTPSVSGSLCWGTSPQTTLVSVFPELQPPYGMGLQHSHLTGQSAQAQVPVTHSVALNKSQQRLNDADNNAHLCRLKKIVTT